jgi:hypothetical protein
MEILAVLAIVVVIAVVFLKGFDMIAGRGPKQVSDGMHKASISENRIPCPMCAEKIRPQARICPFCKSEVRLPATPTNTTGGTDQQSPSAPATEIGRLKVVLGLVAFGLGCLLILWTVAHLAEGPAATSTAASEEIAQKAKVHAATTPTTEAPAAATPVVSTVAPAITPNPVPAQAEPAVPADEQEFIRAVQSGQADFKAAPNEMAQGGARSHRRLEICRNLAHLFVSAWVGKVAKLGSTGDGKGVLEVALVPDIRVETWHIDLSDTSYRTLIEPSSSLFAAVSRMRQADQVLFSGTFFPSDLDCVEEHSVSLEGSMTDPEFVFRFTAVDIVGDPRQ